MQDLSKTYCRQECGNSELTAGDTCLNVVKQVGDIWCTIQASYHYIIDCSVDTASYNLNIRIQLLHCMIPFQLCNRGDMESMLIMPVPSTEIILKFQCQLNWGTHPSL